MPVKPSAATVQRCLQKMGMHFKKFLLKPLLTKRHRAKRRDFCKKFAKWTEKEWSRVIFTDEKMFRIRLCRKVAGWRPKSASKFEARYQVATIGKAEGLMVWGAINGARQLILRRMPPIIDSIAYQQTFLESKGFLQPRKVQRLFQQDGASIHRSKLTSKFLEAQKFNQLNGGEWPPQSPDLNCIEHIWPAIGRRLVGQVINTRDALWRAVVKAATDITPEQIRGLYRSMPHRIAVVKLARGGPTRY